MDLNNLVEVVLSDWIPASTPPVNEGIYEVKDHITTGGYQRYKNGYWGLFVVTVESAIRESHEVETVHPPTHWRGVIES